MLEFLKYSPLLCTVSMPLTAFYSYRSLTDVSFLWSASIAQFVTLSVLCLFCIRPRQNVEFRDFSHSIIAFGTAFIGAFSFLCLLFSSVCYDVRRAYVITSLILQGLMVLSGFLLFYGVQKGLETHSSTALTETVTRFVFAQVPPLIQNNPFQSFYAIMAIILVNVVITIGSFGIQALIALDIVFVLNVLNVFTLLLYFIISSAFTYWTFSGELESNMEYFMTSLLQSVRFIYVGMCLQMLAFFIDRQVKSQSCIAPVGEQTAISDGMRFVLSVSSIVLQIAGAGLYIATNFFGSD